ncbi:Uncharacterized protein Rs2_38849 [Raphanus sativus]|nr:Uncharacterized protein Rs2_38849 [Raphanus sativus]
MTVSSCLIPTKGTKIRYFFSWQAKPNVFRFSVGISIFLLLRFLSAYNLFDMDYTSQEGGMSYLYPKLKPVTVDTKREIDCTKWEEWINYKQRGVKNRVMDGGNVT